MQYGRPNEVSLTWQDGHTERRQQSPCEARARPRLSWCRREVLARIPLERRRDQTIGSLDRTEVLGRSREERWLLDEDQLDLHEDHLHLGYRSNSGTNNTR